jgi:proteasome lid subunit RPN8/RPN11
VTTPTPAPSPGPSAVRIDPDALRRLLDAHARGAGVEPCGFLLGRADARGVRVVDVRPATNVHPRPREAFLASPDEAVRAQREARESGLGIVGTWHGHPAGPAWLSRADAAGLSLATQAAGSDGVAQEKPCVWIVSGQGAGSAVVVRAFAPGREGPREVGLRADRAPRA